MKELTSCNLCGSKEFSFVLQDYDRANAIDKNYKLYRCKTCGLCFVNPQPALTDLSKHYPDNYYSFSAKEPSSFMEFVQQAYYYKKNVLLRLLFFPLKPLIRPMIFVPGGKILDVGCGSGAFLAAVKQTGMDCYGNEPFSVDTKLAKKYKLKIFKGELRKAKYPSNYFDVITLNSVLEHVADPKGTLKEVYRILKPRGTVIVHVPVIASLAYKLFGRYWAHLDMPRHLYLFTRKTLRTYAKATGFSVKRLCDSSQPQFQFFGSFVYWLHRKEKYYRNISQHPLLNSKVISKMIFILFLPFVYLLNLFNGGDEIDIFLTKTKQ